MEWLEFRPWSAEVTQKLEALGPVLAPRSRGAEMSRLRGPRKAPPEWATLLQDWPRNSLWGGWGNLEN